MDEFKYNNRGQMMTGFDNSIDHSLYGHWRNPEYQEEQQINNMTEIEYLEYFKKKKEYNPNAFDEENLPF